MNVKHVFQAKDIILMSICNQQPEYYLKWDWFLSNYTHIIIRKHSLQKLR
jgi:hypothetical protein